MSDRASPGLASAAAADLATPKRTLAAAHAGNGDGAAWPYPGGKNGAGVWQRLISLMPPHGTFIDAFLGSGAILLRKRAAAFNIGIDADAGVIARHGDGGHREIDFCHADALEWMERRVWRGNELVYCDPPYLGEARSRSQRRLYRCELMGAAGHERLLRILTSIPAMVMLSGYRSALYDRELKEWRRIDYQAMTRGGLRPECVWMNYAEPTELHDYRFLGRDFHDRCRIARKIARWAARLAALPALERGAILAALGSPEIHRPPLVPCAAASAADIAGIGAARGESSFRSAQVAEVSELGKKIRSL